MFNVTVINIKKSINKMAIIVSILVLTFLIMKIAHKYNNSNILQINISEKFVTCLNTEIPAIISTYNKSNTEIKEDNEEEGYDFAKKILGIELAKVKESNKQTEEVHENIIEEEVVAKEENNEIGEEQINEQDISNTNTQIVTQNPIKESYNIELNGVKIKNETSFEINNTILEKQLNINKNNVLIFHTHTCESYTPSELYPYQQTGNFRTTDLNYSIARVGTELENYLTNFNFNVTHNKTFHDYPAYSGSYDRSRETVENVLKSSQSDIIIDLHRDAIGSKSNYDPSVKIGEDVAAQLMFVIGTNGGGLYHPDWQSNLKFAIDVQQKANEMYPGLFKPMIVRKSRYNQHLGKAACIIEVGATGNTLEQCNTSMKYLANVLQSLLHDV